jgi:hypothetical protein
MYGQLFAVKINFRDEERIIDSILLSWLREDMKVSADSRSSFPRRRCA